MIPHVPDKYSLARLSTREIAALDGDKVMVVLPVAAVEQHGPHLPVLSGLKKKRSKRTVNAGGHKLRSD